MSATESDVSTIAAPPSTSVGSLLDQYFDLREEYRLAMKEAEQLKAALAALEEQIIPAFDAQGVTLCRGRKATGNISESTIGIVEDWDATQQYILENEALYLLERRLSVSAWRELHEGGLLVPGTTPMRQRKLNVRKRT